MAEGHRPPQRTCLGCRQVRSQSELVRFVRSPDGEVLADLKGRLPGRGAYLCNRRSCMATAVNRKQFDRAFRSPCQPVDALRLVEQVARERLARLANLLGMARKSAHFVAGSNAVLDVLSRKQPLAVIILAGDISPQIGERISWKAGQQGVLIAKLFDKTELGRILGRAERSVVGLPVGQLADAFIGDLHRYQDISGES